MRFPLFLRSLCLLWLLALQLWAADAPYVANALAAQSLARGGTSTTLDVAGVFALTGVSGPLVEFTFSGGKMFLELSPAIAPLTAANFLRYTDNRVYDNTIVHRSIAGFVVQAGGYQYVQDLPHVPTYAPVTNEFQLSNVAGTMAMAKVAGDLNSATSEWFVNLVNNTGLDAADQKFTVFGRLVGDGLRFCQSIAALQTVNQGGAFTNLPVVNYTGTLTYNNLLVLQTVKRVPLVNLDSAISGYLVLAATSSDASIIVPEITPSGLKLTSGSATGETTITVEATDFYDQKVSTSFVARSVEPTPVSHSIYLKASPSTYGAVRGGGSYATGRRITVKAIAKSNRKFKACGL